MGSLMPLPPTGTKRSACATVIEGKRLETKKMTTDEQQAFIRMIFYSDHCKESETGFYNVFDDAKWAS